MTSCALVVGINEYPIASGMNKLFGAVADAADFADWALHPDGGNVAPDKLYFWTHPAPAAPSPLLANYLLALTAWEAGPPVAGRGPTFDEIANTALQMAQTLGAGGVCKRIYVFFAGHGVQTVSLVSQIEPQTCLVANDFRPSDRTVGLVPCDDLRRGLLANGFPEVVMFLDCCRTPVNFTKAAPSLGFPTIEVPDAPYGVGRAARRGAKAFEVPPNHATSRGAFSHVLIEGLRRRRGGGQLLTLNQLEDYVYEGVPRILGGRHQFPQFEIEPRNPPYPLITGPALPQLSSAIVVTFPSLPVGTTVQLFDSNGAAVGGPITVSAANAVVQFFAEPGKLYSLETADKSVVKPFRHEGPGVTDVAL